jgi:hypothetical protein
MGVSVSDTHSDASTPITTTSANDDRNRPTMPLMNATGRKMDTSVSVEASTAKITWFEPPAAAFSFSSCPSSR